MDSASQQCHVKVLEWWKESGVELKYDGPIYEVSKAGCVQGLEWWKKSGLTLEYDAWAMNDASSEGHVNVLKWWSEAGWS